MFELVLGALVAIVGGVVWGARRAKSTAHLAAERALLATPAAMVDGAHVRVEGIVEVSEPLVSPASGRLCAAFHLRSIVGPHWRTHFEMTSFVVRTEHGPVVVDRNAEATLGLRARYAHTPDLPLMYRPAIRTHKPVYCYETVVTPGMRVWVSGVVATEPAAPTSELGFRDTNQIVRIRAVGSVPLVIGDVV